MTRILLASGADLHAKDRWDRTPGSYDERGILKRIVESQTDTSLLESAFT
jgi:hypothetical protein